jgi:dTDP-4-dehydrorhamnose 3,5-epimerase
MSDTSYIVSTSLDGLFQIQRPTFDDDRGFFKETLRIKELEEKIGFPFAIKQANHSRSSKNTLRGIHAAPWNKLIYVPRGKVQAVIVDLRKESPTFGKYESFIIGEDNRSSIFIPVGFGNSYLVLSDDADYTYLTDEEWTPGREYGIAWDDPTLAIKWEVTDQPLLSERDQQNPIFKSVFPTE